ncbi:helix-turn-helix domain-containing protein [Paenibacillus sp. GD4]|uniref:helix-turn-helix domain-containing protein n=1 Tax=Paenibacillus sp. GD4 TaxID=3068890 RepID=UPI0027968ACB|nr:helix-turn-helix domain-containing protein [Paenibacillus sp. GD4]MDQ1910334.1 helix-turn-helix domain-containing protein [Paenibacillus sp. GD4]
MRTKWKLTGHVPQYMKLLLAFSLFIGAIPVMALGLYAYYIAAEDVEHKTKESHMQLLAQTQMSMEQNMKQLELTAMQLANSPSITAAMAESLTPANYLRIRELHSGLYSLQTPFSIQESYLIHQQQGWALNYTSFSSLQELDINKHLADYASHSNNMFWDTGYSVSSLQEGGGVHRTDTLRLVVKLPILPYTMQPKGFLIIDLLKSQLRTKLADSTEGQSGHIYMMDRNGIDFLARSEDTAAPYLQVNAQIIDSIAQTGQTVGFIQGKLGDEEMVFSYRQSKYNGWIYVSVASLDEITRESRKIGTGTLVACSAVLVVVGFIAWVVSRRMYRPIKRLAEMTQAVQTEGMSGKDEFRSLEERFLTLFSNGQRLQQQMQDHLSQLKDYFMLKLFTGQLSEKDIASRIRQYGFPSDWKQLAVLTLQIDTLQDTRYREPDKELLLFAIHNMVGELIPAHQRFSHVLLEQSQVTLLATNFEQESDWLEFTYEVSELIKSKVSEFLQVSVSIGISRPFLRASEAPRAYNESLDALKSRIYLGNGLILHYEGLRSGMSEMAATAYNQLKWTEDQLVQAIRQGNMASAVPWLDKFMNELTESQLSVKEYPALLMQLVSRLYQIVQEKGGTVQHVLGEGASFGRLLRMSTHDDIREWFKSELLEPIESFLQLQSESQYLSIAQRVIQMIQERYDQEITLESCAAELHFHPVYVSRVFKKETGMTFSDYVTDYRMTLAKQWLESTSMKVSDISDKLNYSNTTAFIRTFRKIVGMTPGQYRESNNPYNP